MTLYIPGLLALAEVLHLRLQIAKDELQSAERLRQQSLSLPEFTREQRYTKLFLLKKAETDVADAKRKLLRSVAAIYY